MSKINNKNKGFTLVELSIVIVIIGLIVAGIVGGQTLVQQAQLRSVISEQDAVKTAINAFKLQYNALPGDMTNASTYWTTGCNATASGASTTGPCDGNGDRNIVMVAGNGGEAYMAWLHLSRANLYPGSFVPGAVNTGTINVNIPASKFNNAGITIVYDDTTIDATAGDGDNTDANGRQLSENVLIFGGVVTTDIANGTIFSAPQALSVDSKMDDGIATTGTLVGTGASGAAGGATCITGTAYNVASSDIAPCALAFRLK